MGYSLEEYAARHGKEAAPIEENNKAAAIDVKERAVFDFHALGWEKLTDNQLEALKPLPFVLRSFIEAKLVMMTETQRRALTIPRIPATTDEALEAWKKYFSQDVVSYQEATSTPAYIPYGNCDKGVTKRDTLGGV